MWERDKDNGKRGEDFEKIFWKIVVKVLSFHTLQT